MQSVNEIEMGQRFVLGSIRQHFCENLFFSLMNPLQLASIPCRDLENVEIWLHVPCILPLCNTVLRHRRNFQLYRLSVERYETILFKARL